MNPGAAVFIPGSAVILLAAPSAAGLEKLQGLVASEQLPVNASPQSIKSCSAALLEGEGPEQSMT